MNLSREEAIKLVHGLVKHYDIGTEIYSETSQPVSDFVLSFPEDAYSIKEKKGCVLIMSNEFNETERFKEREEASGKDIELMTDLWREKIGCTPFQIPVAGGEENQPVSDTGAESNEEKRRKNLQKEIRKDYPNNVYSNVTAEQMRELLTCLSETKETYAYIVVVISTHGNLLTESEIQELEKKKTEKKEDASKKKESKTQAVSSAATVSKAPKKENDKETMAQVFYGEDGKPVREKEMIELFYNDEKSSLRGIPKFFILNYCRSRPGKKCPESPESTPLCGGMKGENDDSQSSVEEEPLIPDDSIPPAARISDMVVVYAAYRYFAGFQKKNGSWLIRAIEDVFGKEFQTKGVLDMLTKVNKKVDDLCRKKKENEDKKCKQYVPHLSTSVVETSLLKEFRLWIKPQDEATSNPTSDATEKKSEEAEPAAKEQ